MSADQLVDTPSHTPPPVPVEDVANSASPVLEAAASLPRVPSDIVIDDVEEPAASPEGTRSPEPIELELELPADLHLKDEPADDEAGDQKAADLATPFFALQNRDEAVSSAAASPIVEARPRLAGIAAPIALPQSAPVSHPPTAAVGPHSSSAPLESTRSTADALHTYTPFVPTLGHTAHASSALDLNAHLLSHEQRRQSTLSSLLTTPSSAHPSAGAATAAARSRSNSAATPLSTHSPVIGAQPTPSAATDYAAAAAVRTLTQQASAPKSSSFSSSDSDTPPARWFGDAVDERWRDPDVTPSPVEKKRGFFATLFGRAPPSPPMQPARHPPAHKPPEPPASGPAVPETSFLLSLLQRPRPQLVMGPSPTAAASAANSKNMDITGFGSNSPAMRAAAAAASSSSSSSSQGAAGSDAPSLHLGASAASSLSVGPSPQPQPSPSSPYSSQRVQQAFASGGVYHIDNTIFTEGRSDLMEMDHLKTLIKSCPSRYSLSVWGQVYSMAKHGVSRNRFFEATAAMPCCIIIMKDMNQSVFGGFVSQPFNQNASQGYYGSGECFVFRVSKLKEPPVAGDRVRPEVYRWRGGDDFFMITGDKYLAMGGGGAYAWQLDSNFRFGTSGRCGTYESPMLTETKAFEVNELEVWCPLKDQLEMEISAAHDLLHPPPRTTVSASPPTRR